MTIVAGPPSVVAAVPPDASIVPPWTIEPLWEAGPRLPGSGVRGGELPPELRTRFGARLEVPLHPDRPTLIANFVATLDGVVALDRTGASGGREISGGSEPDRFLMGLLRATADAVVVGAGTARASRSRNWTPGRAHPPSAPGYAAWRSVLGLGAIPTTVLVSASGALEPHHLPAARDVPVMIVTTATGARRLRGLGRSAPAEIITVRDHDRVPVGALLDVLAERGLRLVLSEGGPTLFGHMLAALAIDELFLTLAPQLAGRSDEASRLGLVEGVGFPAGLAPWGRLRSVMRSADHLFLRYTLASTTGKDVS